MTLKNELQTCITGMLTVVAKLSVAERPSQNFEELLCRVAEALLDTSLPSICLVLGLLGLGKTLLNVSGV